MFPPGSPFFFLRLGLRPCRRGRVTWLGDSGRESGQRLAVAEARAEPAPPSFEALPSRSRVRRMRGLRPRIRYRLRSTTSPSRITWGPKRAGNRKKGARGRNMVSPRSRERPGGGAGPLELPGVRVRGFWGIPLVKGYRPSRRVFAPSIGGSFDNSHEPPPPDLRRRCGLRPRLPPPIAEGSLARSNHRAPTADASARTKSEPKRKKGAIGGNTVSPD